MKTIKPSIFHIMAKPIGAKCNLHCSYCFYKDKNKLYPQNATRMSLTVMEQYIGQLLSGNADSQITVSWQGGEPTLMGLEFFKQVMTYEKKINKSGISIENTIQTNGILIDDKWCNFFLENHFLVGISLDGPKSCHDAFRRDKNGNSVFDKVIRAVKLLQKYNVDFNILCTVNSINANHSSEVYKLFRDELKCSFLQFIPIVECNNKNTSTNELNVTNETVSALQYGNFLITIFDEWIKRDVGSIFIQLFDSILASYVYGYSSLCIFQPYCGRNLVLEHNGDLYSCDHFVDRKFLLGNIGKKTLVDLCKSSKQNQFGVNKQSSLSSRCKECEFLFTCYGECPKNRIVTTSDGQKINWLCDGLKQFFSHTKRPMQLMASYIKQGKNADMIMSSRCLIKN